VCPTASPVAWAVQVARALTGVVGTYMVAVYMCDGTIYMVAGFGDFVTKASIAQTEALGSVPDRASRESPGPTARPPFTARRLSLSLSSGDREREREPSREPSSSRNARIAALAAKAKSSAPRGHGATLQSAGATESAMSGNVAATTAKSEEDSDDSDDSDSEDEDGARSQMQQPPTRQRPSVRSGNGL
jgi:hypothetical protein